MLDDGHTSVEVLPPEGRLTFLRAGGSRYDPSTFEPTTSRTAETDFAKLKPLHRQFLGSEKHGMVRTLLAGQTLNAAVPATHRHLGPPARPRELGSRRGVMRPVANVD